MKTFSSVFVVLSAYLLSFNSFAASTPDQCASCQTALTDIQTELQERCGSAPDTTVLRKQPIYVFLSIFDEVSQGVSAKMRTRIYQAALSGMTCDDPSAGVEAAQRASRALMQENKT